VALEEIVTVDDIGTFYTSYIKGGVRDLLQMVFQQINVVYGDVIDLELIVAEDRRHRSHIGSSAAVVISVGITDRSENSRAFVNVN
jgi:hypothetical protein